MNDGQKRRHIRDIAHLYISGARRRDPAPRACLLVTGENKLAFPGFHAANLAAALAARGCEVRLHERSGLLPNAGFYLALPPTGYIPWNLADDETAIGLSGVTLDYAPRRDEEVSGETTRPQVDFFHFPPLSGVTPAGEPSTHERASVEPAALECAALLRAQPRPILIVVVAGAGGPRPGIPAGFLGSLVPDVVMALRTGDSGLAGCGVDGLPVGTCGETGPDGSRGNMDRGDEILGKTDLPFPEAGRVIEWEDVLADRVPAVVRAPDSALANAYLAAADAIRFKMDELRRTIVEPASAQDSDGLRSRSDDCGSGSEGTVLPISRFGARHSR